MAQREFAQLARAKLKERKHLKAVPRKVFMPIGRPTNWVRSAPACARNTAPTGATRATERKFARILHDRAPRGARMQRETSGCAASEPGSKRAGRNGSRTPTALAARR